MDLVAIDYYTMSSNIPNTHSRDAVFGNMRDVRLLTPCNQLKNAGRQISVIF